VTQEEIISMAREAGVRDDENIFEFSQYKYLERFAKLVAEKEREECALLCEEERINAVHYSAPTQSNWLAKKIRAK
jgi:hypothetical protein